MKGRTPQERPAPQTIELTIDLEPQPDGNTKNPFVLMSESVLISAETSGTEGGAACIAARGPARPALQITLQKSAVFGGPVKKTYLTLVYLTVVSANKIKGFIAEKNRFREAVKNRASLLNWADVDAVSREVESKGEIYFTTENTKSTEK